MHNLVVWTGFLIIGIAMGASGYAIWGPKAIAAGELDLKDWHARLSDLEMEIEKKQYERVKAQVAILKNQIRTKLMAIGKTIKEAL